MNSLYAPANDTSSQKEEEALPLTTRLNATGVDSNGNEQILENSAIHRQTPSRQPSASSSPSQQQRKQASTNKPQPTLWQELWASTDIVFQGRLTVLLLLGPFAVAGDATGVMGEALCFACSGISLIPLAERMSFLTEQVAEHTNGTIGALLNATFGNAPELLISVAALRSGYYRVVQLAMLGSMFTNMIFVFGVACLIGGLRWQVQEVRTTSGNVNVVMLLLATAGSLFPSALIMTGQLPVVEGYEEHIPSEQEVTFSRVNAAVMLTLYLCFLLFELGTHKDEFDDEENENRSTRRNNGKPNVFCRGYIYAVQRRLVTVPPQVTRSSMAAAAVKALDANHEKPKLKPSSRHLSLNDDDYYNDDDDTNDINNQLGVNGGVGDVLVDPTCSAIIPPPSNSLSSGELEERRRRNHLRGNRRPYKSLSPCPSPVPGAKAPLAAATRHHKLKTSPAVNLGSDGGEYEDAEMPFSHHPLFPPTLTLPPHLQSQASASFEQQQQLEGAEPEPEAKLSLRLGIIWLFIITLCTSAITDVMVDTIDGFAGRMQLSEVFTSMVIIPFFSNVAEQVSAFIFAYRNEMDLCVGVTVGSAIQIATFVLPGTVLIGMLMDRSMTLFFRGYETVSLLFAVIVVGSILQGGTTNWLVGVILIGVYIIFAAGIWFHEIENLTVDAEDLIGNVTAAEHEHYIFG